MSYANVLPAVAQGTHTTAGEGLILDVGEYVEGKLWVLTLARTSTTRLYPLYQESPDAGAHWLTVKSAATALKATGLAVMTLPALMRWSRVSWSLAGTAASVQFWAAVVAKSGR